LGKLVPLIGDRYEPLLELAGDFAQEMPTTNLDPRIQIGQAGLRAVRSKLYTKLGDSKKAVHLAEEARQIVERLLRGAPESQPLKLRLYELHYVIGDAFLGSRVSQADNSERRNAEEQALTAYRLARDFAGAAATATPDLPGWRTREFTAWMNLADLLARVGQTEKAFATYAEAEQRIRQRLADDPKDRTLRLALATLKDRVGTLHMSRGQTDRAHPAFEEAFSIRKEGLGDMLPEDIEGQKDIAVSFNKLGNVHLATEQWADALRFHRQSLVIREQLVKQEPTPEGLRNYSYSLNNVAKAYRGLKQEAKAVEYHGKRLEVTERLHQNEPSEQSADDLYNARYSNVDILLNANSAGLRDRTKALAIARKAVEESNGVEPRYLVLLAMAQRLNNLPKEAKDTAEKAARLLPAPDRRSPDQNHVALAIDAELKKAALPAQPTKKTGNGRRRRG
jgi:tetratricopeptide (TPR) repeat protein